MAKQLQFRRLLWLTMLLAGAFAGLGYRLVDLQAVRHGELAKEARSNTQYVYHLEPRRGDILDCKGNLLATSIFVKTVCVDPSLLGDQLPAVAQVLAPLLQMNPGDIEKRLTWRAQPNKKGPAIPVQYVMLKRKVSTDAWEKIQAAMENRFTVDEKHLSAKQKAFYRALREKAVFTDPVDDQLRTYPNGALAAHVIGYVGLAEETNNGVHVQATVGIDGIERKFDAKLKGVRGWRVTERDRQEREMVALREEDVPPHDGLNVVLTIDQVIQNILETELADGMKQYSPVSISGIVIRPRTGEILGMATLPNFDPNNPGAATQDARRDRVISDVTEPGSTFKIVVVSGALNDHTVRLTDKFDCENGHFLFAGKVLHDHKPLGVLSVKSIITQSSNIGAAKIGIEMGEARLNEYMREFGFGSSTGVALPYESRGIVHDLTNWTKLSISRIPMGHEVCVTSLQMAMAMSAVANKGILMQPMLVDRLVDTDGTVAVKYSPQQVRRVIGEEADRDMIEALKTVVTEDGTAVGAGMTNYVVAGKTGTAQESLDGRTYAEDKYFASFIGFFPADNPEICIYVAMDAPKGAHYGGETAAPIFHRIAVQAASYLNIKPDKGEFAGLPEVTQTPAKEQPAAAPPASTTIARAQ